MRNLLRANLFRLRRDGMFWMCAAMALLCAAGFTVLWCLEDAEKGLVRDLDDLYFRFSTAMGFFYAMFTCLFLSVEHGEGTVRNKLAAGHTRRAVYLANLLTVFAACLCIALAWLAGGLAGVPFLGPLKMEPAGMALYLAVIAGYTAAFSAIYACIGMLNDRRSVTAVTISVWLILLLASSFIENALYEKEFVSNMVIMTSDGVEMTNPEPNPYYISGVQRAVYEFLMDFLPTGQASCLQQLKLGSPARMVLSSAFITVSATWGGLALFARKDLR